MTWRVQPPRGEPLEHPAGRTRPGRHDLTPLLCGAAAGALGASVDALTGLAFDLDLGGLAGVACVDLLGGWLLGLAAQSASVVARRLPWLSTPRRTRSFFAALVALALLPSVVQMFSGPGISRTLVGHLGPFVLTPAAFLAAWALLSAQAWLAARGARWRWTGALMGLALGGVLLALERRILPGLYFYLHATATVAGLALLALACSLVVGARRRVVSTVLVLLTGLLVPMLWHFPATNAHRHFMLMVPTVASRLAPIFEYLADLDRDGASSILSSRDCAPFDPNVNPGALEIPGNGVDENCDGADAIPPLVGTFDYGPRGERARSLVQAASGRPTVVVLVDTLRADRVGDPRFPNLSRLQQESIAFDQAYAPATSTLLVMPAITTGYLLSRPAVPSLFDIVKAQGQRSAMVAPDAFLDEMACFGKSHDFDAYPLCRGIGKVVAVPTEHTRGLFGGGIKVFTGAQTVAAALRVLDEDPGIALLWIHLFDLHQWHHLSSLQQEGDDRYDETLQAIDLQLEPLLARRDSINLVLVADHGELLYRKDVSLHGFVLYRELVHVPVLLRIPGVEPGRVSSTVALEDLAPTLLDLLGLLDAAPGWTQRSLLQLVGGPPVESRIVPMFEHHQLSLIEDGWRYIHDIRNGSEFLFNLRDDREETRNLAAVERERCGVMFLHVSALYAHLFQRSLEP